jgi:DNA/RNA-binding domain of Phe-tRNA-synthetase-like protein
MEFMHTDAWMSMYPDATAGILAMGQVANPQHHPGLDERKEELERALRARYEGYERAQLKQLPVLQAYGRYYKKFKKTYHVQLQLESVVLKDKSLPRVAALVEAMFMAELKNLLLTAGHDLDVVQPPVRIDVAEGSERYVRLNGTEQELKARDMYIGDAEGVLSSILYGPDQRTQIRPETQRVLFTVYGAPGIEVQTMREHLEDIRDNVMLIAPGAAVEVLEVYGAG